MTLQLGGDGVASVSQQVKSKQKVFRGLGLYYLSDITPLETRGSVHPTAVDTITTYTLPASPPAQTLTHTYLAFHTWLATKMGVQASLL